jgi:hypothetical protein
VTAAQDSTAYALEPVVDVMDAVAVEVQAIEYRKKNAP